MNELVAHTEGESVTIHTQQHVLHVSITLFLLENIDENSNSISNFSRITNIPFYILNEVAYRHMTN